MTNGDISLANIYIILVNMHLVRVKILILSVDELHFNCDVN